jgi:hypothetical protein
MRENDHREAERYIIESERQWAESVALVTGHGDGFLPMIWASIRRGALTTKANDRRHAKCTHIRFQSP